MLDTSDFAVHFCVNIDNQTNIIEILQLKRGILGLYDLLHSKLSLAIFVPVFFEDMSFNHWKYHFMNFLEHPKLRWMSPRPIYTTEFGKLLVEYNEKGDTINHKFLEPGVRLNKIISELPENERMELMLEELKNSKKKNFLKEDGNGKVIETDILGQATGRVFDSWGQGDITHFLEENLKRKNEEKSEENDELTEINTLNDLFTRFSTKNSKKNTKK